MQVDNLVRSFPTRWGVSCFSLSRESILRGFTFCLRGGCLSPNLVLADTNCCFISSVSLAPCRPMYWRELGRWQTELWSTYEDGYRLLTRRSVIVCSTNSSFG